LPFIEIKGKPVSDGDVLGKKSFVKHWSLEARVAPHMTVGECISKQERHYYELIPTLIGVLTNLGGSSKVCIDTGDLSNSLSQEALIIAVRRR